MNEKLKEVFASNPVDIYVIRALDITLKDEVVRICDGYEDLTLGGNKYIASDIGITIPKKSTNGQQKLNFEIFNATGEVERYIDQALEENITVMVTFYEYLSNDLERFASKIPPMAVSGGVTQGMSVKIEAEFQDTLNMTFQRERYTSETSPGIQYI